MAGYLFPILPSDELIMWLCDEHQLQDISEDDFKNPQPYRVQLIYKTILETEMNLRQEKLIQPQFEAAQLLSHAEFCEEAIMLSNFSIVMVQFMNACDVQDFKLKDLTCPKPKRTMRMLSAIANFCRFKKMRMETYYRIKDEVDGVKEQHEQYLRLIDEHKTQINNIKALRAEKEVCIQEMADKVEGLGARMNEYKQDQAVQQQDIHRIKTSFSEKSARLEQLKLHTIEGRESCNKLRPQIIQSPERIKTDMTRMHNAIAAGKKAKEDRGHRLHELKGQKEKRMETCEASEQGVKLIMAINNELEKQKESKSEVEKVRDHILTQKDALRDLTAKEAQRNRQLETKQEKFAKVQLQHQHSKEDVKEIIKSMESDLKSCSQKQQKKMEQISAVDEKKAHVREQLAEAEMIHDAKMAEARASYSDLLQSIDAYHKDLAVAFEKSNPKAILGAR
ncbi:kinetochore protein Nuf2-like [Asterias rubens]|uniref:kinetochore protein Nuf2-like n=1 Tax=Asterias rubens TaxID=7604 RepID=UPI0014557B1C|nr:kinetochore protein Nuf2-like [Asterias rubens]XP_033630899.1 kinetochore protein Nuf2-like [Asterias rubens]